VGGGVCTGVTGVRRDRLNLDVRGGGVGGGVGGSPEACCDCGDRSGRARG